jgi:hypothetical protein
MVNLTLSLLSLAMAARGLAGPLQDHFKTHPVRSRTIVQLGKNPGALENVAVRKNGDILATMIWPNASLYTVQNSHPFSSGHHSQLEVVHTFPDSANTVLGIKELQTRPDTFLVSVGSYDDFPLIMTPGSMGIWEVTFLPPSSSSSSVAVPAVSVREAS